MKKLLILALLVFANTSFLFAHSPENVLLEEELPVFSVCHSMALAVAEGKEGQEFTDAYNDMYNRCEDMDEEEEIADGY
ncbi:hypothetical protein [Zunongwangia pacifica]|uniref:Secreted protein n=1 Tax=Zunongwangia pacifica TaxID=2911062 RepID=A0A9X1ZVM5_9FLAO|nr:hypothetical protein [Zunongwangia pacifica]MCL6219283.1 hypothetical protein [Zunongwangia pacifica]